MVVITYWGVDVVNSWWLLLLLRFVWGSMSGTIDVELARLGCLVGPGKGAGGSGEPLWEELCVGR